MICIEVIILIVFIRAAGKDSINVGAENILAGTTLRTDNEGRNYHHVHIGCMYCSRTINQVFQTRKARGERSEIVLQGDAAACQPIAVAPLATTDLVIVYLRDCTILETIDVKFSVRIKIRRSPSASLFNVWRFTIDCLYNL